MTRAARSPQGDDRMSEDVQRCPLCRQPMVTLGETADEVALMCGYCTYNCIVLAGPPSARPDEELT
ncbi:hypothetical protein [Streptomyces sp. C10-9-1]|uniref:hypothetical protein n=1 Tax=Streptomyces sp. C10-9-1 TaxID=1859285 RepID=UPI003F4A4BB0